MCSSNTKRHWLSVKNLKFDRAILSLYPVFYRSQDKFKNYHCTICISYEGFASKKKSAKAKKSDQEEKPKENL